MSRPLFEQYKDALRRGHVALLGDDLEQALAAYREAAALVPDRPLPHASIGAVLARLGRREQALEAYDRSLAIAPDDDATLQARDALLDDLRSGEPTASEAVSEPVAAVEAAAEPGPAAAAEPVGEPVVPAVAETAAEPEPAMEPEPAAEAQPDAEPSPQPEVAEAAANVEWPAIDLPSPPPPPLVGPPPDPASLQAEADAFVDAGDPKAARDPLLLAMAVHRDAGRVDAALDSCLQLLAIAPGDPRVHLAIANLQLDRGWRPVATEKIELLLRLTSLSGDAQAEADVHLLAADRLRDESPARLDARRRGAAAP
ncbi:MAG TPA: tetratricopeptide repeat protein [Candidatus Limnocylindrales bacterium]|nr:tetratricopeptide repeat protein [Candidatus Limnocylindrales bacterium]